MNRYSKMKTFSDTESRSMDSSSDLTSLSSLHPAGTQNHTPKTLETYLDEQIKVDPVTTAAASGSKNSINKTQVSFSLFSEQEDEEEEEEEEEKVGGGGGEDHQEGNINYISNDEVNFGGHVKLSRNSSVSASSVTSHALQSAVKRAFSLRRSSSVSERYRRIHDQTVTLASPIEDEDLAVKNKKKSSKTKFIKACKKIFGL